MGSNLRLGRFARHALPHRGDRCGDGLAAQPGGLGAVDLPGGIERNAIITARLFGADQTVEHVVAHAFRIADTRIAKPAAAGKVEAHRIARRYRLPALWADRPVGTQRHGARSPCPAAVAPKRRILDPLEIAQTHARGPGAPPPPAGAPRRRFLAPLKIAPQRGGVGSGPADLDDLAEAAAKF